MTELRESAPRALVGTASWAVPREHRARVDETHGTTLVSGIARYAAALGAAEINTTFYRRHRESTFVRWRDSVPASFLFSVKMPRAITHEAELAAPKAALVELFSDLRGLGEKLGAVLVQLAPSHAFERAKAQRFFATLRALYGGPVVLEPRHPSWFSAPAAALLGRASVPYVVADPPRAQHDALDVLETDGARERGPLYVRLHGTPRMYWSPYPKTFLENLAAKIWRDVHEPPAWVIFDNTASGAAFGDALALVEALRSRGTPLDARAGDPKVPIARCSPDSARSELHREPQPGVGSTPTAIPRPARTEGRASRSNGPARPT